MYKTLANKYTLEQVTLMWTSIAYNDCRQFAFFDGTYWRHPKTYFSDVNEFYTYICRNRISDVHVKSLPDNGGREWIIDVDIKETDNDKLKLKIEVSKQVFRHFFGNSVTRIMYSGNRGIHVWLRIDRFRMSANKESRGKYYKAFVEPKVILLNKIEPGSFIYSIKSVLEDKEVKHKIDQLYKDDVGDLKQMLHEFWPAVDRHVFCNLNQIRTPYSYNFKGKKFSTPLN
ncbi:late expression factor 1 [Apocheima cinerarium nucleopolyhedrovirus]|uniref:late expression factor 1 n=1 Tax=Apocheima cinerarium nucleopolyhedrovirus TaxID=307461 RepID=UPI0001D92039|nr:late expression factor 1 [Apocheima cinerarium nucleopolyhedrovirus]ADB84365.1 late expression factor 1 [Apocheima cinerarium nucleopolyhedrovirus]